MPTNDTQLMDEEEMIMTINVNNDDDHDDEELLDDIEIDDEARDEADDDSIIILKIQPNIVLNEHDPNHCFYIKCQARVITLRQVQEILYAFCLANDHSYDDDDDDDDSVRQSLQYYHQKCHYSNSSSMPNSLHNPLVFINQKPNDDLKSRVVQHHDDRPIHSRYQIRFILMGQLLLFTTTSDDHHPNGESLASIPQVMKLLTTASTFLDDDDTPVITIHAVVTKRHLDDTTTKTTPVLPPPLFQQQQSQEPNRIEPEDDEDLLFYPDDDDDDSDDDTNAETDRHLVSLFINHDDDDDDNDDESDSSVVERDDHHRHDTVDAANTTTTRSPPLYNQNGNQNRNRNIPLGFDALRVTAGLNRHDITILRLYFNQDIDQWIQQQHRQRSSGRATSQSLFPTSNLNNNNNNNNSTITNYDNNTVDTLRLRRLQEEAWMNVQGPYSEFRYNINAPLLSLQQQRVGGTRTHQSNNNRNSNNNEETTSVVSPLLALQLPPSPATIDNNHPRPDGHHRSHNHLSDGGTLAATASLTRAIRNRVTSGSQDAVTMYRRAAVAVGRNASGRPGSTILPLHNGGTNSPGNGNHHAMPASLGSDRDFIYGVIFGSMVGSGMLLWIWIPTVSYKQKLGILFGYALHITMNMIHKSFRSDEHFGGDHNMISPDDIHYHNYRYSKNFLINDDTLQLGE